MRRLPAATSPQSYAGWKALWTALSAAAVLSYATACGPPAEVRPNLLLVTVDSTRPDFLACYGGNARVGTAMCSLGDAGARYTWAFSAAPSSAPAIGSLFSSDHPSSHGVRASAATFLRGETETLASVLRANRYATAAFVGSPELNRSRNLQRGFDLYDDRGREMDSAGAPERRAEELTDAALAWIAERETPWFVWIHYRDPHGPYDAPVATAGDLAGAILRDPGPEAAEGAVRASRLPGPGERLQVLPTSTGRGGIPGYQALPGLFTREAYELRYEAEIRYVDGQFERLLGHLAERGSPIGIVLTADHGEAFGEDRYFFTHGHSVGLDQIRVPLFWRPPRSGAPGTEPSAERIDVPVSTLDVAPTLLQAAGIAAPDSFVGRPLPTANDVSEGPQPSRAIFSESETQAAVVVGGTYYARDRTPAEPIARDDPSRNALAMAHGRTARLEPEAAGLPTYQAARPAGAATVLEPRLADFLTSFEDAAQDALPVAEEHPGEQTE